MSAGAQDQLSQLLLEPTLCLCIALFLLQTRCDVYLYSLSIARKPPVAEGVGVHAAGMTGASNTNNTVTAGVAPDVIDNKLDVLNRFLSSTCYFQSSVQSSSYRHIAIQNKTRYDKLWNSVHHWFPQKLITLTSPCHVSLSALTAGTDNNSKNTMNDSFRNKLFQKVFRDVSWEELVAAKRNVNGGSATTSKESISCVIDTATLQAMAIHNYYKKYL